MVYTSHFLIVSRPKPGGVYIYMVSPAFRDVPKELPQTGCQRHDSTTWIPPRGFHSQLYTARILQPRLHRQDSTCRITKQEFHSQDSATRIPQPRFHRQDSTCGIPKSGFRSQDSRTRIPQPGFRILNSKTTLPGLLSKCCLVSHDGVMYVSSARQRTTPIFSLFKPTASCAASSTWLDFMCFEL